MLGKHGRVTAENVMDFKFLNSTLKEALRLNPAIMSVGTRVAVRDTEIAGVFIPNGLCIMWIHHYQLLFITVLIIFNYYQVIVLTSMTDQSYGKHH